MRKFTVISKKYDYCNKFYEKEELDLSPLSYDEIEISQRYPISAEQCILNEEYKFRTNRIDLDHPKYLLLGWEIWLQLGIELSNFKSILKPLEYRGYEIIVDEEDKDKIQFIPEIKNVRFII